MEERIELSELPEPLRLEITQRLSGLACPQVRLIPYERRGPLLPSHAQSLQGGGWTKAEAAAAAFYEASQMRVARLSMQLLFNVQKHALGGEALYKASDEAAAKAVWAALQEVMPQADIDTLLQSPKRNARHLSLDGLSPRKWPVSAYMPDLVCGTRRDGWRFVEVKGPGDSLHFRQANWFVNVKPERWVFEICMPMAGITEPLVVAPGRKPAGPRFAAALAAAEEDARGFDANSRILTAQEEVDIHRGAMSAATELARTLRQARDVRGAAREEAEALRCQARYERALARLKAVEAKYGNAAQAWRMKVEAEARKRLHA